MKRASCLAICYFALLCLVVGCGGGEPTKSAALVDSGQTPWKVYHTDPGADPSVPAEQGGAGFEEIAEELGFVTHEFTEQEIAHLGDPRAKKGGTFTHIAPRFPATMRIYGQYSNYQELSIMAAMVYQGLVNLHPTTLEFIPELATHWKISDDKMTFWFRINPDARWSDGKPVTSEDVVATWNLLMDEGILFPSTQMVYGKYEQPVAESKYIVRVKSKTLNWRNFLYFGASMHILPAHHIGNISGSDYLTQYQFKMPPGSGAYIMLDKDIKKQQSYALTRRPDFWAKDLPHNRYRFNFDKVKWVVVKDNVRLEFEKLKAGEQDFYLIGRAQWWIEETDFEAVQKGWVQKRRVWNDNPQGANGLQFNMRTFPFDDKRIRQAFVHLYPRERMMEELFFNQYILSDSFYAGGPYENPNNPKYRYNPDKAVKLLREAGWKTKNKEGILVKDGQPFLVEIAIVPSLERVLTPMQQELKKVGIDFQLKLQDQNTMWKMAMQRKFQVRYAAWTGLVFPNPETSYKSELADKKDNNNMAGVKNERIDEICDEYDVTFEQARRVELIQELDGILMHIIPTALSWYGPYDRVVFWNKFGMPDFYFGRFTDYHDAYTFWWYEEEKAKALEEAMANGTSLPVGDTEVTYWPEFSWREDKLEQMNAIIAATKAR